MTMTDETVQVSLSAAGLRALRKAWQDDDSTALTTAVRDLFQGGDGELHLVNVALRQARARQLKPSDVVVVTYGDWALIDNPDMGKYVAHVGEPVGWPVIEYDIDAERLNENWERQLGEKTWMSDQSKSDLAQALADARVRWAALIR